MWQLQLDNLVPNLLANDTDKEKKPLTFMYSIRKLWTDYGRMEKTKLGAIHFAAITKYPKYLQETEQNRPTCNLRR